MAPGPETYRCTEIDTVPKGPPPEWAAAVAEIAADSAARLATAPARPRGMVVDLEESDDGMVASTPEAETETETESQTAPRTPPPGGTGAYGLALAPSPPRAPSHPKKPIRRLRARARPSH